MAAKDSKFPRFNFKNLYDSLNPDEKIIIATFLSNKSKDVFLEYLKATEDGENMPFSVFASDSKSEYEKIKKDFIKNEDKIFSKNTIESLTDKYAEHFRTTTEVLASSKQNISAKNFEIEFFVYALIRNEMYANNIKSLYDFIQGMKADSIAKHCIERKLLYCYVLSNMTFKEFTEEAYGGEGFNVGRETIRAFSDKELLDKKIKPDIVSPKAVEVLIKKKKMNFDNILKEYKASLMNELKLRELNEEKSELIQNIATLEKQSKKLEEKELEISKLNHKVEELTATIKQLEATVSLEALKANSISIGFIEKIYDDMKLKDIEIEKLRKSKEILVQDSLKDNKDPKKNVYESLVVNQEREISKLKNKISDMKDEYTLLQAKINKPELLILNYLHENVLTKELIEAITPHYEAYKAYVEDDIFSEAEVVTKAEKIIGYVEVIDGEYYAVNAKNKRTLITDVPEKMYIAENQFVLYNTNGKLLITYQSLFYEGYQNENILQFAVYSNLPSPRVKSSEGETIECQITRPLKDTTIIGLDESGKMVKYYKHYYPTVDDYYDFASLKGHKFYYIKEIYQGIAYARDIERNVDVELSESYCESIREKMIITVKGHELVNVFYNVKMYTFSNFYKDSISGFIYFENNKAYLQTLDDAEYSIDYCPSNIQDGDYATIDEFGNILSYTKPRDLDDIAKKMIKSKKVVDETKEFEEVPIKGEILIIGNPHYRKTYISAFKKKGYIAKVVSGYAPLNELISEAKGKIHIALNPSHAAHQTFYFFKDNMDKVTITKHNGANRIIEDLCI